MNARELYEQFDEWLRAKYAEVTREWDAATDDEVRAKCDELLRRICLDIGWIQGKLGPQPK